MILAGAIVTPPLSMGDSRSAPEHRRICGLDILAAPAGLAAEMLCERLENGVYTPVGFVNAHCVNLAAGKPAFRAALGDFVLLPDGLGIDLGAQLLFGESFPDNLNGTDFVPFLLSTLSRPMRIALIGSSDGIVERAADALTLDHPQHVFLPIGHGFFAEGPETEKILGRLRAARADIVLVALGMPRQELFIAGHLDAAHATMPIAVGALLDFMAGKVPRAPSTIRRLRLEWAYRLMIEPRRLWRRYLLGNPRFMLRILVEWRRSTGRRPR